MKKVYLQPSIYLHALNFESEVLTGTITYTGSASEEHHGGEGTSEGTAVDAEGTPTIGGTGDNSDFTMGAPVQKYLK